MSDHTVSFSPLLQPLQLLQPYTASHQPAIMSQMSQTPPVPQPQQILKPEAKKSRKSKKVKQPKPSPFDIQTFTSAMLPISDISRYPIYCGRDDKGKPSAPIIRARRIFDIGKEVPKGQDCSRCLEHGQTCVRGPGFSKCCYCTAEDLHPKEMCHLPGVADPPEAHLSMTALSKKRKMDARTEAVSATTMFESAYGQSHFQVSTPAKRVRGTIEYPVSKQEHFTPPEAKTQGISTASEGARESIATCPASTSAGAESDSTLVKAMLERVAALEDRVSSLEKLEANPKSNGGSGSVSDSAATTPSPSWGIIADIVRVHDKDGNLLHESTDLQVADNDKEEGTTTR